jgi:hypothetical protein
MDRHETTASSAGSMPRRLFLKAALATAPALIAGPSLLRPPRARAQNIGPSTTRDAYLLPTMAGVETFSILTVGDSVNGYRMVGVPDGLGAFRSEGDRFTLLMNHEITAALPGVQRAHGRNGAFVSRWVIDRETFEVVKGEDLTPSPNAVFVWDTKFGRYTQATTQWHRLCSADLPQPTAFLTKGLGTPDRIFCDGEEITEGRAWARIVTGPHAGEAWQLPRMGRLSFENVVASPSAQERTVVVLTDDSAQNTAGVATNFPSEVYLYVGRKQRTGHPIEQAGLTNGTLYGLTVSVGGVPVTEENDAFGLGTASTGFIGAGRFGVRDLGDVSGLSALMLEQRSIDAGVARFQRCEDGAWDPRIDHARDYYFVTTASLTANSRLWRLRFDDLGQPERGGTIEIVLKGDEGHRMLDNVTIDRLGRILMDEDPGDTPRVPKIWLYAIDTAQLIQVAAHNSRFFDATIPNNLDFITQNAESSGIIDAADILEPGWFLLDVQAHKVSADVELVEGGQLLALFVDPRIGKR